MVQNQLRYILGVNAKCENDEKESEINGELNSIEIYTMGSYLNSYVHVILWLLKKTKHCNEEKEILSASC